MRSTGNLPPNPEMLVRPVIRRLHPYVPGEQPNIRGLLKLNTNENPYPPAPPVLAALGRALDGRLRLYPNPSAEALRSELAAWHGCRPENIIIGNGSDELLALAVRAFVEPLTGLAQYALQTATDSVRQASKRKLAGRIRKSDAQALTHSRYTVQFFRPSYSLYGVLAEMHGAWPRPFLLGKDFALPRADEQRSRYWDFDAALTFVTTPHAPSGRAYSVSDLEALCQRQNGVVVLDEAYVDFAEENALKLALRLPNVLVARTFSKAYSLCFLRVGYFVAHPALIGALHKIRDSYNVNGLAQVAASATLRCLGYYRANFRRVRRAREWLSQQLFELGFEVLPSQTNFVLVRPPVLPADVWLEELRRRKILVRWFDAPETRDCLRITVGTDQQMQAFVRAARQSVGSQKFQRNRAKNVRSRSIGGNQLTGLSR